MIQRPAGQRQDDPRSLTALLVALAEQVSALVRGEIRLLKAEAREKLRQAVGAAVAVALAVLVVFAGFLVLLAAAVMGLSRLLPPPWAEPWIAALIVATAVLLAGFAMLAKARSDLSARGLSLTRTARNLQADEALVKDHLERTD